MEIIIPKIRSVKVEPVFVPSRVHGITQLTRVTFRDGRTVTLSGNLSRKEATYQAFLSRAKEAGLPDEEAHKFAATKYPEPLKKGA